MADKKQKLKKSAHKLPLKPGIYLFKDQNNRIIYIGKARSIKDRVKSYFSYQSDSRIKSILNETEKIDFIITDSEREAFFLENNFIRQYQPKFNLRLKDDKSYPYIKITIQDKYPGLYLCRRTEPDGARYFGPFTPASAAHKAILLIKKQFGIRGCKEDIPGRRKRPCLDYDINQCSAPCVGYINESEYNENVNNTLLFLEGKTEKLKNKLKKRMNKASDNRDFEQAKQLRDLIYSINQINLKPKIISVNEEDKDIFGFFKKHHSAVLYVFSMRKGKVIESSSLITHSKKMSDKKILSNQLIDYYSNKTDFPEKILLPFEPLRPEKLSTKLSHIGNRSIKLQVPQKGNNKRIVELATRNAEMKFLKNTIKPNPLKELQRIFNLKAIPNIIEGIDISNTGGKESVGSVVVFKHSKPSKKDYRKYKIKSVKGPNDIHSIQEVVYRRYKKLVEKKFKLPDLILIDGGKGHLNAAQKILNKLSLSKVPIISIAKREEIIFTGLTKDGIKLDKTSSALKLLQYIRDEAHRSAITFHRKLRKDKSFESYLDKIQGIGPKRKSALLEKYGDIKEMIQAPMNDLAKLIGKKAAHNLKFFIYKKK
ncbi:MAG: excinuclease ABC subunit UvrC [Acidobacteriota bacterium]